MWLKLVSIDLPAFLQGWPLSDKERLESSLFFFKINILFRCAVWMGEKTDTQKEGKSFIYSNSFVVQKNRDKKLAECAIDIEAIRLRIHLPITLLQNLSFNHNF